MEELKMKKLVVLLALVSFAFVIQSSGKLNYVTVGDKTYFSDDVKVGVLNIRIETEDGLTVKAPLKKVNSYMVDGKLFERLPLICYDGHVKCTELLELVAFRNGLRLFKYYPDRTRKNLGCCFYDESNLKAMFYIYKDGELYLRVNKENAQTVFPFFGIEFQPYI